MPAGGWWCTRGARTASSAEARTSIPPRWKRRCGRIPTWSRARCCLGATSTSARWELRPTSPGGRCRSRSCASTAARGWPASRCRGASCSWTHCRGMPGGRWIAPRCGSCSSGGPDGGGPSAFPRRRTSDIPCAVDPLRLTLPVMPAPAAVPMDADTAAAYGLKVRGDTRAQGLFDRFGRGHTYLRISVTERCNLRCRYCMPEEGVQLLPKDHLLSFEEIERVAALFVRLGVRKIRLTGGEPLVRRGVDELVARIGKLKPQGLQRLAMTSNALLLRQHLEALRAGGLDAVNLSLDTLQPERFRQITLRDGCEETIDAIRAAAAAGFESVKVNAVVMAGVNDDELVDLARAFALKDPIEMRYIEYMPFEGNHWGERLRMFPAEAIRARLEDELVLEPHGLEETALVYDVRDKKTGRKFEGTIGIISSMTEPFCASCNRIRLTADGHFRWCLLDEGELDLRAPLRSGATDSDLAALIEEGLHRKLPGHAPAEELLAVQHAAGPSGARSMIRI